MSGGYFDYSSDHACNAIFNYMVSPDYGNDGFSQSVLAAKINPLEDRELSELLFDMFCIVHSYDWYTSGDTDKETYLKDVKYFKDKWFNNRNEDRIKRIIDETLADCKQELYNTFCPAIKIESKDINDS